MSTDPDVTLTDYGLAAESALCPCVLYPREDRVPSIQTWFVLFLGGTVHGFFLDETTLGAARGFVGETARR